MHKSCGNMARRGLATYGNWAIGLATLQAFKIEEIYIATDMCIMVGSKNNLATYTVSWPVHS